MKYRDPHQLQIDWTVRLTEWVRPQKPKPPDKQPNPFIFNKHEVCTNPEVVEIYKSGRDIATVLLAQEPYGMWCYGYQFDCYDGGSGSGASYGKYRKTFTTRQDALLAALDQAQGWSEKYKGVSNPREAKAYEKFNKAIEKFRASLIHLI